ncbi:MAG: succinylglutamate desuccinylase/aspartoacylase family protein [Myxococcales bacterium]|nr:succinylglutamate desuccinylase/aspartoacylase family protein [Myxococcales bacterium]MCB9541549.1 succinylglutamate desuccinylase/aspartoacylase family protein [Myxococcales bacterium]
MQAPTLAPDDSTIPTIKSLDLDALTRPGRYRFALDMVGNGLGSTIRIPIVVVRGRGEGPTLGLTAVVHGNELNGIMVIHRVLTSVDPDTLRGVLVAVPVVNVPGFLQNTRVFNDGADLNRLFPGKVDGTCSQVYCHRFTERLVRHLDYLVDLHTASTGRINTLYVRADMSDPMTAALARAQRPQIILHNCGVDGTLRSAAAELGVPSITVEVGNPQRFQLGMVEEGHTGVLDVMGHLGMLNREIVPPATPPVLCIDSKWLYTTSGGLLHVLPALCERVKEGQEVARVTDVYGALIESYRAPRDGIVIGRSVNPVNQTGSRILHLGRIGEQSEIEACPLPGRE